MKKLAILILCLTCLQMSAQITTYNINNTINCTDTLQPFGSHTLSYGLSIDGEGQLLSDSAFIRVVMVDNNGKFALLIDFAARPEADSLDEFDLHYFHLLLSELLYKNYCEQSNRAELQKAVAL